MAEPSRTPPPTPALPDPLPPCPSCGAGATRVVEDVVDEVVVLGCGACDTTWAHRRD